MNRRHDPLRLTPHDRLSLRPARWLELNPPRSKVVLSICVNGATIADGWHCSGRAATSDVCTPAEVWKYRTWDGATTARLFKGFIMVSARSIHIGSENIYPLWNGWSNNGPVVFKDGHSETAISSGTKSSQGLQHNRNEAIFQLYLIFPSQVKVKRKLVMLSLKVDVMK